MEMVSVIRKSTHRCARGIRGGQAPATPQGAAGPLCRKAPGPTGRLTHCPGKLGATPALAIPGGHPSFSQPQGTAWSQVAFSPREQYSQGIVFSAGWLFVLSRVGDAVNDVERGCKMG